MHGNRRVGVHPIQGPQGAPGLISLAGNSRLRIRLPSEEIAAFIAAAGQTLDVEGYLVRVGIPRVEGLIPAVNLGARLVTFRHALSPKAFEEDVRRELMRMAIAATPQLVPATRPRFVGQPVRRVMRIKDKRVVGYALRVFGLTAEESIRLQEEGLGGRRRMGCGVFVGVSGD
jgi:CRISPR-associated protein Cas6